MSGPQGVGETPVNSNSPQDSYEGHVWETYYTFGGRIFHQAEGGQKGLRETCAVARLIMQLFDRHWGESEYETQRDT